MSDYAPSIAYSYPPPSSISASSNNILIIGGLILGGFFLYKQGFFSINSNSNVTATTSSSTADLAAVISSINAVNANQSSSINKAAEELANAAKSISNEVITNVTTKTQEEINKEKGKVTTADWLTLASQALSTIGTTAASMYSSSNSTALATQQAQYNYEIEMAKLANAKK